MAPVNPPSREYLTPDELMERWQWSEVDLLHAVAKGAVKPSAWVSLLTPPSTCDAWAELFDEDPDFGKSNYVSGFVYLVGAKQTGRFDCSFDGVSPSPDGSTISAPLPSSLGHSWRGIKHQAVFMLAEVEAFESRSKRAERGSNSLTAPTESESDQDRRWRRFLELGGYVTRNKEGEPVFNGSKKLHKVEKEEGRPRIDPKTIKKDLVDAFEREQAHKRGGGALMRLIPGAGSG